MAIGGVISAAATSHTMLVAGRVLVGIGMSPAECLAGVLVADLFFVVRKSSVKHMLASLQSFLPT